MVPLIGPEFVAHLLHPPPNENRAGASPESRVRHATAGGMGGLLVQWARHLGATVIGTASTEEKESALGT